MAFVVKINGTDRTSLVRSMNARSAGAGTIGEATIVLMYPASAGYTFVNMQEVQIYSLVGGTSDGIFGGFISTIQEQQIIGTSELVTTITCRDYNVLLDYIIRDSADTDELTVSAATFPTQIAALVQAMQRNGDSAVFSIIDATTFVQNLTGATVLSAFTVKGRSLRQALQTIMNNAQGVTAALRPRYTLSLESDGAGGVQAALKVWDGAAPIASVHTFDTSTKELLQWTRFRDASMPLGNRIQLVWTSPLGTFVYTYASVGTTYTNNYQSHVLGGVHKGYFMLPPLKADTSVTSAAEALRMVNRAGAQREFPRETWRITYDHAATSTLFIRPGQTVHITTSSVSADYEVTEVSVAFPNVTDPRYQRVTLTCGLPMLRLFDDGTQGQNVAPIIGDIVPPNAPGAPSVTLNSYNPETGYNDLVLAYAASTSIDTVGYVIINTFGAQSQIFDVGNTTTPTISLPPQQAFSITNYAYDGANPRNLSAAGGTVTGTTDAAYETLVNPDYEQPDRVDITLPYHHTRTVANGGTAVRSTTNPKNGAAHLRLTTTATGGSTAKMAFPMRVMKGFNAEGLSAWIMASAACNVDMIYSWYDAAQVFISSTTITKAVTTSYARYTGSVTPPSTARFYTLAPSLSVLSKTVDVDTVSSEPQTPNDGLEPIVDASKLTPQASSSSPVKFKDENGDGVEQIYWSPGGHRTVLGPLVNPTYSDQGWEFQDASGVSLRMQNGYVYIPVKAKIGDTSDPTAILHLLAGTATANTAPQKFTSGTLLTTPEAGAVEYDGNAFYATPVVDRHNIQAASSPVTSTTTVTNTATETTIFTGSISANELKVGRAVIAKVYGRYTTGLTGHTGTLRFKVAGVTVATLAPIAASPSAIPWEAQMRFTVRTTGATGTIWPNIHAEINNALSNLLITSTSTIDTTAACDVTLTWQWSAANASDQASVDEGWLEFIH